MHVTMNLTSLPPPLATGDDLHHAVYQHTSSATFSDLRRKDIVRLPSRSRGEDIEQRRYLLERGAS